MLREATNIPLLNQCRTFWVHQIRRLRPRRRRVQVSYGSGLIGSTSPSVPGKTERPQAETITKHKSLHSHGECGFTLVPVVVCTRSEEDFFHSKRTVPVLAPAPTTFYHLWNFFAQRISQHFATFQFQHLVLELPLTSRHLFS